MSWIRHGSGVVLAARRHVELHLELRERPRPRARVTGTAARTERWTWLLAALWLLTISAARHLARRRGYQGHPLDMIALPVPLHHQRERPRRTRSSALAARPAAIVASPPTPSWLLAAPSPRRPSVIARRGGGRRGGEGSCVADRWRGGARRSPDRAAAARGDGCASRPTQPGSASVREGVAGHRQARVSRARRASPARARSRAAAADRETGATTIRRPENRWRRRRRRGGGRRPMRSPRGSGVTRGIEGAGEQEGVTAMCFDTARAPSAASDLSLGERPPRSWQRAPRDSTTAARGRRRRRTAASPTCTARWCASSSEARATIGWDRRRS